MPESTYSPYDAPLATPTDTPALEQDGVCNETLAGSAAKVLKVLVADDSPLATKVISVMLRRAGYEVITAADGIEATQAIYRERPDVVLLDIFMPRMNGYQVCRLIKQDVAVSHIPVIINTASEGRSAEFWSRHTGADAFSLKSASPDELIRAIKLVTSQSSSAPTVSDVSYDTPSPEEILSRVCALVDQELYATTVRRMELETILANLTEGILMVDNHGSIRNANHFLCNLLGVQETEIKTCTCGDALGAILGDLTQQLTEQALAGERGLAREGEVKSKDGKITPVEISAIPVHDYLGEVVGAICVFQDITRRREIETLNRLKNDLTDMIVHDLRTPLTSLLVGMETIDMIGEMSTDQRELLNISIEGGQILLGMINDLLDISKMEDGSMKIKPHAVEGADLTQRALRQVTTLAEAKGLQLLCNNGVNIPTLLADDDKMLRTLVNLLSNAIKFTPAGGSITLGTHLVVRPGRRDSVVFECQDTGEGIPAESFARIFEKFGQVESRSGGRRMSTGLGLTFCKMAVEAHGGRIWVQSNLGHGSMFQFAIPVVSPTP